MWAVVKRAFGAADNADAGLWNSIKNAFGFITGAIGALFVGYVIGFFAIGVLIFILTPPVMLYCQYLWGLVTMLVAILLGPIFVPFLLIPQLSFSFLGLAQVPVRRDDSFHRVGRSVRHHRQSHAVTHSVVRDLSGCSRRPN